MRASSKDWIYEFTSYRLSALIPVIWEDLHVKEFISMRLDLCPHEYIHTTMNTIHNLMDFRMDRCGVELEINIHNYENRVGMGWDLLIHARNHINTDCKLHSHIIYVAAHFFFFLLYKSTLQHIVVRQMLTLVVSN